MEGEPEGADVVRIVCLCREIRIDLEESGATGWTRATVEGEEFLERSTGADAKRGSGSLA